MESLNQQGDQSPIIPINSPVPPYPVQQKSKIPFILGGILLFFLLVGGAYYLGTQGNRTTPQSGTKKQVSTVSPAIIQPTTVASPTNLPLQTDTPSGWKEYRNDKHGFTINYPKAWTETGPVSKEDTTILYIHADEKFGEGAEPVSYYVWITEESKLPNVKLTKEKLGEYTVYKTQDLPSRSGAITSFITTDEKRYIAIAITPYDAAQPFPSQDKYLGIYNQILSSFRFTK